MPVADLTDPAGEKGVRLRLAELETSRLVFRRRPFRRVQSRPVGHRDVAVQAGVILRWEAAGEPPQKCPKQECPVGGPFPLDRDMNPVARPAICPGAGGKTFAEPAWPGEEINNGDRFSHHDPEIGPFRGDRNSYFTEIARASGVTQP